MKFLALALLSFSLTGLACDSGFLPANKMRIPVGAKFAQGGINEDQFNAVISKVEGIYASEIASEGGRLVMNRAWTDEEVNAFARREGRDWIVHMSGGLARHSAVTEDGLALVVCHELGHHIGGAPKKLIGNRWSSAEGQSDYFAATKCLRRVFLNDNNAAALKKYHVPLPLITSCYKHHRGDDRNICIRIAMAGQSVAKLFQQMGGEKLPMFHTPDKAKVAQTFERHPATQCRMDTFFQGALCGKSFHDPISQNDEVKGFCHSSLGDTVGLRPGCWFKSK